MNIKTSDLHEKSYIIKENCPWLGRDIVNMNLQRYYLYTPINITQ